MASSSTYKRIAAVRTAMQILTALSMHKEPASAKTLAQGLSLPVGTVLCHLTTLEDEGFVRQIGDCWVLGMALARIWARVKSREESRLQEAKRNLTELNLG